MCAKKRRRSKKNSFMFARFVIFVLIAAILVGGGYIYKNYFAENKESDPPTAVEGTLTVHCIDVGQGDAQIIVSPKGDTLLIDAGPGSCEDELLAYIDNLGITELDYAIFTHYDEDHIGSGDAVLNKMDKVGKVLMPNYTPTTVAGKKLLEAIENKDAEVIHPEQGYSFTLSGGASVKVLSSDVIDDKGSNGDSIVTMITFGESDFLLTGDATSKNEKEILEKYKNSLDCEVFTAGHHGSDTSNSADFLGAAKPEITVISCGLNNKYGHPNKDALDRIKDICDEIYRTDEVGSIVFTTDGDKIDVKTLK